MEHANWAMRIFFVLVSFFVLWKVHVSKKGKQLFIRKIAGLDAIDEAIGRATEMGRPIMFNTGWDWLGIQLFCSLACLSYVTRRAAKVETKIIIPVCIAVAYPLCEEYWKDAYAMEGRQGLFDPKECIRFLSDQQPAYAMGTTGWMEREKVGANFIFGYYGYESLLIAEGGQRAGAMQVACVHSFYQVPFLIVSCDYTVFGEEFYAAGAYFGRDPVLVGGIVGQDYGKILLFIIIIAASILAIYYGKFNPIYLFLNGNW
jgi:hypothetical protein